MQTPTALFAGLALIAVSIAGASALFGKGKYEIAVSSGGMITRLDTQSGAVSYCEYANDYRVLRCSPWSNN